MKCPDCGSRKLNVYEMRGFTSKESPIKECDICGLVWRLVFQSDSSLRLDIIARGGRGL